MNQEISQKFDRFFYKIVDSHVTDKYMYVSQIYVIKRFSNSHAVLEVLSSYKFVSKYNYLGPNVKYNCNMLK